MNRLSFLFRIVLPAGLLAAAASGRAEPAPEAGSPIAVQAVVDDILARNAELAFYEAEIDAARAALTAAGARENPELALELGRKRVTDGAGTLAGEGTAWSVSLAQAFDWPGRIPLRKAIANRDLALAELGLARFRSALAQRARTLACGLHAAHERARAAGEVAARYQALRELFVARDPGGITPLLETRVIEAQELALQHRATGAALDVQAALVELNQLRGLPVDTPVDITEVRLTFAPVPDLESLLAAAREGNFELRAARLELEQQGFVVSLARHERRPGFTVSPYYAEETAGERERTYGVGLSLPIPVSARGGAGVAAAEARQRQAETAVFVAQRAVEREVITTAQRLGARLAELSRWSPDAGRKFREAAELADRHYRLGAVPISTYVELQNAYLDAVDALHATEQEIVEAGHALQALTGLEIPFVEITHP